MGARMKGLPLSWRFFVQPGEIAEMRIIFPTPNVDTRQVFVIKSGARLHIDDARDDSCKIFASKDLGRKGGKESDRFSFLRTDEVPFMPS